MANELDLAAMKNIARQRAEDVARKANDIGSGIENKFDDVLKLASPERQNQLLKAQEMAKAKDVPLGSVLSEMMVAARNKLNPLTKVPNLPQGFGKIKAIPGLGALALGASAMQSGDAAAAGMDYLVPGGVEDLGGNEENELKDLRQKQMVDNMKPDELLNYTKASDKAEDLTNNNEMQKKLLQQFAGRR